jgi:membrane fusion protein (multidrug efflux system)
MPVEQRPDAILIPQISVTDRQGVQTVFTLSSDNTVQLRNIEARERVGPNFVVTQGLKPGDRLIVEGIQKVRPGAPVNPQPYQPDGGNGDGKPSPEGEQSQGAE